MQARLPENRVKGRLWQPMVAVDAGERRRGARCECEPLGSGRRRRSGGERQHEGIARELGRREEGAERGHRVQCIQAQPRHQQQHHA